MTMTTKLLCTVAALLLCGVANAAATGKWVSFEDTPYPPSALQVRLAAERGVELSPKTSPTYWGRLYRPEGKGPFPAIVFVETCVGPMEHKASIYEPWIETLSGWGYVVLRISRCTPDIDETTDRTAYPLRSFTLAFLVHAGFSHLSNLPFVEPTRIGVIGWSVDGTAALNVVNEAALFDQKFRLVIAFYPQCGVATGPFIAPVLVLIGAKDDWTLVKDCQRMANEKNDTHVKVYPKAFHGFDLAGLGKKSFHKTVFNLEKNPTRGMTTGYNQTAHQTALREVEAFLNEHLASKLPE